MACDLELIKHQEKTLDTTLVFCEAALCGLGEGEKAGICPKKSPNWFCSAVLCGRHTGSFAAPRLWVSHTGTCPNFVQKEKNGQHMMLFSHFPEDGHRWHPRYRILKEAPRLHNVAETREIKKKNSCF